MSVLDPLLRRWPWIAFLASAALLAAAHAFERFGGLPPCTLCLRQREVHWAVLAIAAAAIALSFTPLRRRAWLWSCLVLAAAFAWSAYQGGFHTGVEWHWWRGPEACSGGGGSHVTADDLNALLNGGRVQPPACDRALWHFLGLSMAAWNGLISLGLTLASILAAFRGRPTA
jgi:disulfide bond formation protein DsbB